jgi:hypothetical protein
VAKLNTPAEVINNSEPDTVKVTESPLSASVAVTVSIAVWFSAALKIAEDVNTGAVFGRVIVTVSLKLILFWYPYESRIEIFT